MNIDDLFWLAQDGILNGNEKRVAAYCRFVSKFSPEEKAAHDRCASILGGRARYPNDRNSGPDDLLLCECRYCDVWRKDVQKAYKEHLARVPEPIVRPRRKTFIYIMRNERNGLVKIGRSLTPLSREATLQSEEPEITMLFHFPATEDVETQLHERFEAYRVRGEWFRLTSVQISGLCKEYECKTA